jgi:hypothetical protein
MRPSISLSVRIFTDKNLALSAFRRLLSASQNQQSLLPDNACLSIVADRIT